MTVFEVNRIFTGLSCPHCSEKIMIEFDSDNLFLPFRGFRKDGAIRNCCAQFHDRLNSYLKMHQDGRITEMQLLGELTHYK